MQLQGRRWLSLKLAALLGVLLLMGIYAICGGKGGPPATQRFFSVASACLLVGVLGAAVAVERRRPRANPWRWCMLAGFAGMALLMVASMALPLEWRGVVARVGLPVCAAVAIIGRFGAAFTR